MSATHQSQAVVDREELLTRAGGDVDLAIELVNMMLRDLPAMHEAIRRAAVAADATALMRAAHALKGAVANFSAADAMAAAERLERMGRQNNLGDLDEALNALQQEVQRLSAALPVMFEGRAP